MLIRGGLVVALAACHASPAPPRRCPTTIVRVASQAELDRLAGCVQLAGLAVRTAAPLDLAPLEALARVDGDLVIGPSLAIGTVRLPALATVGGVLQIAGNGDLAGVYLPRLTAVGALSIRDDVALVQISMPALLAVAGAALIARAPSLELIDTSATPRIAGGLIVHGVPSLVTWIGMPITADGGQVDAPRLDAVPTATQP